MKGFLSGGYRRGSKTIEKMVDPILEEHMGSMVELSRFLYINIIQAPYLIIY